MVCICLPTSSLWGPGQTDEPTPNLYPLPIMKCSVLLKVGSPGQAPPPLPRRPQNLKKCKLPDLLGGTRSRSTRCTHAPLLADPGPVGLHVGNNPWAEERAQHPAGGGAGWEGLLWAEGPGNSQMALRAAMPLPANMGRPWVLGSRRRPSSDSRSHASPKVGQKREQ